MRLLCLSLLLSAVSLSTTLAGRLDVAVVQFPENKSVEEIEAAFSAETLFDVTNSNRTMSSEKDLKGGYVVFAQSLPLNRGGSFGSSTRINNERADVQGRLGSDSAEVSVELVEGVKAGLRSYQNRVYSGSAPLPNGVVRVLSMRQIKGKAPYVVKGQAKMEVYGLTIVLLAQYTP